MRILEEPILTLQLSKLSDSDSTEIEISICQTSASFIFPVNPSQRTDNKHNFSSDPFNARMKENTNELEPMPKIARSLIETLTIFQKCEKSQQLPPLLSELQHALKKNIG
ncbi:hypothetical protein TNCT_32331 [Trichonephila clavata]|uniref:Uncharacterized protein n=1 Tax=Trichonephila clavata TaxID=2740835 RepID=A0A8X6HXY7_TRICU|nr:hypothetical protein TNCT_32331 [Trichonephila clavata]